MADVCEVTGTSLDLAGDVLPNAAFTVYRGGKIGVAGAANEISWGENYAIVSNASGVLGTDDGSFTSGFALVQGWNYYITYTLANGQRSKPVRLAVPEGTTSSGIAALIVNDPVPSADSAALALAAAQAINAQIAVYDGWDALDAAWSDGLKSDGALVSDGRVLFVASSGATAISSLPGLLPFGGRSGCDIRHWTANNGDGLTSVSDELAEIISYCEGANFFDRGGRCHIPAGNWLLTGTTSPWFTIQGAMEIYGRGNFTFNETTDVIILVQPENVTTTSSPLHNVDFTGVSFINTTDPSDPNSGNAPVVTAAMRALTYDRAMGTLEGIEVRNACIDLLGNPEGMRINNCDTTSTNTGTAPSTVTNSAHIRIRPRVVDNSGVTPNYQWTSGTGADNNYYTYPNSVYITNHNMRAGAIAAIDQTEATIIVEAVDGLYMDNGHVAWGTTAPLLLRPRHAQAPFTNIKASGVLFDPLPGKSANGIKAHDYWSQSTTVASGWDFKNSIIAGCTGTGFVLDVPMTGFSWKGGEVKGVGTGAGYAFEITGGASGVRVGDVAFRNVGASSSEPCVYIDDADRVIVGELIGEGGTYGIVEVTSNATEVVVGTVNVSSISGGETIVIPAASSQVTVTDESRIAEGQTVASATSVKVPLGVPGVYITGTTGPITTIDTSTMYAGRKFNLRFASAPTINETGNILLGAAAMLLEQGRSYDFVWDGTLSKACLIGAPLGQGAWTPVLTDGAGNDSTLSTAVGYYVMTGNMVHVTGRIIVSTKAPLTGNVRISGLPIAVHASRGGAGVIGKASNLSITAGTSITLSPTNGQTYMELQAGNSTGGTSAVPASAITDTTDIQFSAAYSI